jgi:secreted PhoX family phosphatase
VWKANKPAADGNPSSNDIARGQTLQGRFVPLSQADNVDADTLEAAAQAKGAFDFVRLEDVAVSKTQPGVVYFDDTGALGQESVKGRLYKLRINPNHPTRASLTVLLDGDAGDDMVNPDNLDVSQRGVMVIQEDRNAEHRGPEVAGGYGRVLVYDLASGALRPVARVNTPASLLPGTWESSGVIDASRLLGEDWWLLDVQAHDQTAPQPGPDLEVNSSVGEDGQLLAIRIPHST